MLHPPLTEAEEPCRIVGENLAAGGHHSEGNYAVMIWLDHASADVKQAAYPALAPDLSALPSAVRARLVYPYNPINFSHTHASPEKISDRRVLRRRLCRPAWSLSRR
jgi:hypothetical protein